MNKKILFLHIPKTAGSTIITSFKNLQDKDINIKYYSIGFKSQNPKFSTKFFNDVNLNKNINILSGHFVFSEDCKNFNLFTMVRNILDLFISNLYFMYKEAYLLKKLNIKNTEAIKKNIDIDLDFSDNDLPKILNILKNNYVTSNIITKTLAGIPFNKFFYVFDDNKIKEEDFLKARQNLEHFSFIGQAENINFFIKKFLNYVPINTTTYTSVNIFKKKQQIVDKIKNELSNEIINYNYYDSELLSIIKKKF